MAVKMVKGLGTSGKGVQVRAITQHPEIGTGMMPSILRSSITVLLAASANSLVLRLRSN